MDALSALSIDVAIEETPDHTDATATMTLRDARFAGWGRARRNPADPNVPKVGEELAVARALADLSHRLIDVAATEIGEFEGHPVHVGS